MVQLVQPEDENSFYGQIEMENKRTGTNSQCLQTFCLTEDKKRKFRLLDNRRL